MILSRTVEPQPINRTRANNSAKTSADTEPSGTDEGVASEESPSPQPSGASAHGVMEGPSRIEARRRSEILHDLIHQLLLDVHEHYYREDEGLLLPSATFRNVFDKVSERQNVGIHWLAVDAPPMNVDHRPKSDFEHAAVKALMSGQSTHDEVWGDQYRFAGAIRLTSACLKCHVPNRTSLRDRLARIVITMPLSAL